MTKKKKANKDKKTNKKEKRSLLEILFYAWVFIFFSYIPYTLTIKVTILSFFGQEAIAYDSQIIGGSSQGGTWHVYKYVVNGHVYKTAGPDAGPYTIKVYYLPLFPRYRRPPEEVEPRRELIKRTYPIEHFRR